jgi:hypothetical protein
MLSASVSIAIQEIKHYIPSEGDLIEKLKFAMAQAKNHWLLTKDDEQFRAAVGAVMLHYGEGSEEFERIEWEMGNINRFSAALVAAEQGVGVDFGSVLSSDQEYDSIGLLGLWREV